MNPAGRKNRPSLLKPIDLEKGGSGLLPPPPPIETRPRNASGANLEMKLDVLEQLIKEQEEKGDHSSLRSRTNRVSILEKLPLDMNTDLPPPPSDPRPVDADDFNFQEEIALREQLFRQKGESLFQRDYETDYVEEEEDKFENEFDVPLPRHNLAQVFDENPPTISLQNCSIERIATYMESTLFTVNSIDRARKWMPKLNDVVIASFPRCGQSLISLMARLLCAKSKEKYEEILNVPDRCPPWLELSLVDHDPHCLLRKQTQTDRRFFRTRLSHSMLSTKMKVCPDAKFITVFRNPIDLRCANYEHLKSFFVATQMRHGNSRAEVLREEWVKQFPSLTDDFMKIPVSFVQSTKHYKLEDEFYEYEANMKDWVTIQRKNPNCLFLFYEEIIVNPENVLKKLAEFLNVNGNDYDSTKILEEVTGNQSRRHSDFGNDEEGLDDLHEIQFSQKN